MRFRFMTKRKKWKTTPFFKGIKGLIDDVFLKLGLKETNEEAKKFFYEEGEEKEKKREITLNQAINASAILTVLNFIIVASRYLVALVTLDNRILSNNACYIIPATFLPICAWIASTTVDEWNFHNKKILFFKLTIANAIAVLIQPFYTIFWKIITINVFRITVTAAMTEGMIIMLAQFIMLVCVSGTIASICKFMKPMFFDEQAEKKLKKFKITHHIDTRKNKENLYDLKIVKNLETGKNIPFIESDRFVHMVINGASGTGKTSSTIEPAVESDIIKKILNKKRREESLVSMLLKGKAYMQGPVVEFDEYAVKPYPEYEKEFKAIWKKYPDCGMTVIAPNNSVIKDIVNLCAANNLKVNVLDPAESYKAYDNVEELGINPFYIPLDLSEEDRAIMIENAGSVFSEVLIAINEKNGKQEVYFSDITKAVSTNISMVCMLARNIERKQTDIVEIETCMSNFNYLKEMVDIIEHHYGVKVIAPDIATKGKKDQMIEADALNASYSKKEAEREAMKNPYYKQLLFIKSELLGAGQADMYSQARGLRNLITKLLNDSRIRNMLAAPVERRVDFDMMLANNEITLLNTALEYGSEKSTALGLFFILSQKVAVLRRPVETRSNHFMWVDEVAQYIHPVFEDIFALYRQYRVAVGVAIQALSQMSKNDSTKYLGDVLMGAGTHIVFGRLSPSEMELYSTMAGANEVMVSQKTVTQTSIFSDNPSLSVGERITPTLKNNIEGSDMRHLDFQEVTVLTIKSGRVLEGQLGKVNFLPKDAFEKKVVKKCDFEELKKQIEIRTSQNESKKEDIDTGMGSDNENALKVPNFKSEGNNNATDNKVKEDISVLDSKKDVPVRQTMTYELKDTQKSLADNLKDKDIKELSMRLLFDDLEEEETVQKVSNNHKTSENKKNTNETNQNNNTEDFEDIQKQLKNLNKEKVG